MKYKHLQIFIGACALLLIPINIYFNGHILVNISMFFIALGMGIQALLLHKQEKKSTPSYVKAKISGTSVIFFLFLLFTGCIGFFSIKKWWGFLIVSIVFSVFFGIMWFLKTNKK